MNFPDIRHRIFQMLEYMMDRHRIKRTGRKRERTEIPMQYLCADLFTNPDGRFRIYFVTDRHPASQRGRLPEVPFPRADIEKAAGMGKKFFHEREVETMAVEQWLIPFRFIHGIS